MAEPNPLLDRVVRDVQAICQPLGVRLLHKHEEEPLPHVRVEISAEPHDTVRVILYPAPSLS